MSRTIRAWRAERLQRELLGLVAAAHADRVRAALAVDAAVGLERRVVPGAEQDRVLARAAVHQVGVVAGHDRLRPRPARDHVGAGAGLDGRRERKGVDADLVRARARVDRELAHPAEALVVDQHAAGAAGLDGDAVVGSVTGDREGAVRDGGEDGGVRRGGERERRQDDGKQESAHRGILRPSAPRRYGEIPGTSLLRGFPPSACKSRL